jgi:ATP-dependent Clp protease ATP-binding subunit ClpC
MFERFDQWARQVVVQSQAEARRLGHTYIGTEHELLGLLEDTAGAPAQVLAVFGIDAGTVREQIVFRVGRGDESPSGQIPFTPMAKKVLELALREALSLQHENIRPGHVLLGLLRVEDGMAVQILVALGAVPSALRELTLERLGGPQAGSGVWHQIPVGDAPAPSVVKADDQLRGLTMETAERAAREHRSEFGLTDLLDTVRQHADLRGLLGAEGEG